MQVNGKWQEVFIITGASITINTAGLVNYIPKNTVTADTKYSYVFIKS